MKERREKEESDIFLVFKKDEEVEKKKEIQIKEEAVLEEGGDRGDKAYFSN